jgi:hypothetical protein
MIWLLAAIVLYSFGHVVAATICLALFLICAGIAVAILCDKW